MRATCHTGDIRRSSSRSKTSFYRRSSCRFGESRSRFLHNCCSKLAYQRSRPRSSPSSASHSSCCYEENSSPFHHIHRSKKPKAPARLRDQEQERWSCRTWRSSSSSWNRNSCRSAGSRIPFRHSQRSKGHALMRHKSRSSSASSNRSNCHFLESKTRSPSTSSSMSTSNLCTTWCRPDRRRARSRSP